MSKFENITIIKKANVYFDGKVTSRTIQFKDGTEKTLGIMLPGDYTFNTEKAELMEIIAGDVSVKLANDNDWKKITEGSSFNVAANSSFTIKVKSLTDYCCSFID